MPEKMLPVQAFPWEAVLAAFFLGIILWAVFRVRKRWKFARSVPFVTLPRLETGQRITATINRVYRDPDQAVWLVDTKVRDSRLVLCITDHEAATSRYQELIGKEADLAIYALATLAPGGVESIKEQIVDADKIELPPDMVRLLPQGTHANDYVVIGRVLDHRDATWDDLSLIVYRTEVVRRDDLTLIVDLFVPRESTPPFAPGSMVHGSARLFSYLAS